MDVVITEDTLWLVTLWIADFIETLPTEINAIWRKKLTGASVLFLINRYIFLLYLIFEMFTNLSDNQKNKECDVNFNILNVLQILAIATTNVLFALRVYAIYNKNRIILGTCSVFIISRLVIDILVQITSQGSSSAGTQFQSFSACVINVPDSNVYSQVEFVIPFITLGYDIYIFGLTMRKTIDLGFKMKRQGQTSVAHVIVQDVVLLTAIIDAILARVSLHVSIHHNQQHMFIANLIDNNISSPFFTLLPNMLISRLMLNLRTFPTPGTGDTLTTSQRAQC
ncbi:hypothetical protein DFJ43DRAFT_1083979 [Lentinula guzmanii]|uniref:DUF6533 domain-containing protein n=1 Tax=Lentinula guzmanii TaxID=2804957 RepID=A0AA38MSS1_9AGAR|nr:hypothetical protein DFJ43DRAFT_1083979 [Lentinula guzmanii]